MKKNWLITLSTLCAASVGLFATTEADSFHAQHTTTPSEKLIASNSENELTKQVIKSAGAEVEIEDETAVYSEGLTLSFPEKLRAGDKGKLNFKFDNDKIKFEGSHVLYYDETMLTIDEKGNWEALSDGTTTIMYGYQPSAKMLEAIVKAGDEAKTETEKSFAQYGLTIATKTGSTPVSEDQEQLTSSGMEITIPEKVTKGETGELSPTIQLEDQEFEADYTFYYDSEVLAIDEEGNWEALETGTATVLYSYQLTEEITDALTNEEELEDTKIRYNVFNIEKTKEETDRTKDRETNTSTETKLGITFKDAFEKQVEVGTNGTFEPTIDMSKLIINGVNCGSVAFDGAYTFSSETANALVDADGYWTVVHKGEVKISYSFVPSEKMLQDLKALFAKENKEFSGIPKETIISEAVRNISSEFFLGTKITGPTSVNVGDNGTFTATVDPAVLNTGKIDFSNITFEGQIFFDHKDGLIEIDEEGNWNALKAGEANIGLSWMPSDKMLTEMLTVIHHSKEKFAVKDLADVYIMNIKDASVTSDSSGKNPGKLPQTGEQGSMLPIIIGGVILAGLVILIFIRRKNKKDS